MTLLQKLMKEGKHVNIPNFIRKNAKTRSVEVLRKQIQLLIETNENITFERTSEIFITKGTKRGERNLKYYPKIDGFYISHLIFRSNCA